MRIRPQLNWLVCLALLLGATLASAQFAPPTGLINDMASAPVGGPGPGAVPNVPGGPTSTRPTMPMPMPGQGTTAGAGYYDPTMMMMMQGYGMPGGPGVGATASPTASPTPLFDAWQGQRIIDAVSSRTHPDNPIILDDPRKIKITEEEKNNYSDDGVSQNDLEANDQVYTQIIAPDYSSYIGGTTEFFLRRIIVMLRNAEEMSPLDFFGHNALAMDRFSSLPSFRAKQREQMEKIAYADAPGGFSGWSQSFLKNYRKDPTEPNSGFFQLYVPRPPAPPSSNPPSRPWLPRNNRASQTNTGVSGMGPAGMNPMMMYGMAPAAVITPGVSTGPLGVGRARDAANMMGR